VFVAHCPSIEVPANFSESSSRSLATRLCAPMSKEPRAQHAQTIRLPGQWTISGQEWRLPVKKRGSRAKPSRGFASLEDSLLFAGDLTGADLSSAELRNALLVGAYLQDATLVKANFQNAILLGAHLEGADLSQAELRGANLQSTKLGEAPSCSPDSATRMPMPSSQLRIELDTPPEPLSSSKGHPAKA
jgi:hypothetical protein